MCLFYQSCTLKDFLIFLSYIYLEDLVILITCEEFIKYRVVFSNAGLFAKA